MHLSLQEIYKIHSFNLLLALSFTFFKAYSIKDHVIVQRIEKETKVAKFFFIIHIVKQKLKALQRLAILCIFSYYSSTSSLVNLYSTRPSRKKYPQQLFPYIQPPLT